MTKALYLHAGHYNIALRRMVGHIAPAMRHPGSLPSKQMDVALFEQKTPLANEPLQAEMSWTRALLSDDMQRLRKSLHAQLINPGKRVEALQDRDSGRK